MIVIGLVGGIASGKSSVAQAFGDLGAAIIRADEVGHAVLNEPAVQQAVRERWGDGVFAPDGSVDRKAIARLVFAPPPEGTQELRYLESITHPRIDQQIHQRIRQLSRDRVRAVILDAPVLLEAGWARHCDRIVFVDVPREERVRRAASRGWTECQFAARESAQLPLAEKQKVADEVIDNSGQFDHTLPQIHHFWNSLKIPPE